jgi:predicted nuclease of predicted toxin-antitoxin system
VTYRLFFDECLIPGLVQIAIDAGHYESTSVRDRGLLNTEDRDLIRYISST